MMGFYDKHVLPHCLNLLMKNKILAKERSKLVPKARGEVLEVGIGSGLNLPFYGSDVRRVTGVDPSLELQEKAQKLAAETTFPVEFKSISSEALPFEGAQFDTAVITWTMCTIPDPSRALAEVKRVLKPGGMLLFVEHGHAPDAGVARWQDRLNSFWPKIAGGCNLNRPIYSLVDAAGFDFDFQEAGYIKGPKPLSYMYRGIAHPA